GNLPRGLAFDVRLAHFLAHRALLLSAASPSRLFVQVGDRGVKMWRTLGPGNDSTGPMRGCDWIPASPE
ncbi:MAG TPA: hypothetical protein VJ722_06995, partial [Rhodanobacteraceae bacterium]|nr:hypothetical protein [Rhodanobacteraceae bacterium]